MNNKLKLINFERQKDNANKIEDINKTNNDYL